MEAIIIIYYVKLVLETHGKESVIFYASLLFYVVGNRK